MGTFRSIVTALALAASLAVSACGQSSSKKLHIYLLPKVKGIPYFETCAKGAQEAAKELGVQVTYDGPVSGKAQEAAKSVEQWTVQGADVLCVSANDPAIMAPAMKAAMKQNVHVITWDADTPADSRELFVNQATARQIGEGLVDTLAKDIGNGDPAKAEGDVAIVTATLTAANQNEWMKYMKAHLDKTYPRLKLIAIEPSDDNQTKALQVTGDLIKAHPNLKGVWAISSAAFPGAAEAIKQAGKAGQIQVTGLSTPNDMKKYVKDGTVKSVVLWNTVDLGYLTIYTAHALATGQYKKGDQTLKAGRLGEKQIVDGQVLLGPIMVFNKDNIDQFDF
jgi:rhamnose transport system substrate-binding protein